MPETKKIGMFYGVLVPNITMMFGVILFLRLGILVGSGGILTILTVIGISLGFMLITSLSIASIATNMRVGGGGVYYLITRSLGIEIGGAVGFALYLSQIISMSLTISGFAYTLCDIYPQFSLPVVEAITLLFLGGISSASSKGALKLQVVILVILLIGIGSVFFGSMENVEPLKSFEPYLSERTLSFWQTFAYFYPAMTGIEAGMAMSGILRKPGRSLFIGNISSLIFVAISYALVAMFAYSAIPTEYLQAEPFIFMSFSSYPELVTLGILTATISSALGSVLGAPRILESMARDDLVPAIFAKVYGKYQEPRWALWMTIFAVLITAVTTNIDQIIPILTMICLITYGLLNLVAGLNELMNTAAWRPTVRVPWWVSMIGFLLAGIFMLFINVAWTLIAIALFIGLFFLVQGKNLSVGFQDIRNSMIFFFSRTALYHLGNPAEHAMVWHPQLLVIATGMSQHQKLVHLAHNLTYQSGLVTFSAVVPTSWAEGEQGFQSTKGAMESFLEKEGVSGLVEIFPSDDPLEGQLNLIKAYGIGAIQPNTIVFPLESISVDYFPSLVETSRYLRKNLLLYKGDNVEREKKKIDLWWNGEDRSGFDLAVSLATTLRVTKSWANGEFHLKTVTGSKPAKKVLEKFFKEFIGQSRLHFIPSVHFEPGADGYLPYLKKYSSDSDLTIICIRGWTEDDEREEYLKYIQEVLEASKDLNDCLYISCYDEVEHKEIYHYPSQ